MKSLKQSAEELVSMLSPALPNHWTFIDVHIIWLKLNDGFQNVTPHQIEPSSAAIRGHGAKIII